MEIMCVKYSRSDAGRTVPFDRVYLAKHADRKVLRALFQYALVMPLSEKIKEYLEETTPRKEVLFGVNDRTGTPATEKTADWAKTVDGDWVVVVPILTKFARENVPRYLMNARWYEGRRRNKNKKLNVLPSLAYLQTPEKIIRPVCVACPRFLENQAGKCQVGQPICYTSLALGGLDTVGLDESVSPAPEDVRDLLDSVDAEVTP
jgi:hypothetical protein